MMKIGGKQIGDNTITQSKLAVSTASVVNPTSVTTKEWVENKILYEITGLTYSNKNLNMSALATTANTNANLACNTGILDIPNSNVRVNVNGVEISVGGNVSPYDCFFSPDGIIVRAVGSEILNDKLYWNTNIAFYQLDVTDKIDFIYIIRG